MSNSGKHLENLVKQIESLLLPAGFTIESRERIFNDEGIQIAEFDIVITGKIGSSPIKILIECRDRPTEGPAPASWIEQLVGRRIRFKFDKVVAVSTTGFSNGAKQFAHESGIEYRLLDNTLNLDAIASWFRHEVYAQQGLLKDVKLGVRDEANLKILNKALDTTKCIDAKELVLIHESSGETINIATIWGNVFQAHLSLFTGLSPGDTKRVEISMDYERANDKYQLPTDEGLLVLDKIIFEAEFSIKSVLPSQISQYSQEAGNPIAESVHYAIDKGDGMAELIWYKLGTE